MATGISNQNDISIGEVFTPIEWARWLLAKNNVFSRWKNGAVVCDPTAGRGAFALALFQEAVEQNVPLSKEMLSRLHLIELKHENLECFRRTASELYNVTFPEENLHCADVITSTPDIRCDVLVGNPPSANFADLPATYKETLKPYFQMAGLVADKRASLLGASRTDIAALVLKIALGRLLRDSGSACFFTPSSLFSGDSAHDGFRDYAAFGKSFAIKEVFEFTKTRVFDNIATSFCGVLFANGEKQRFPVSYRRENKNHEWDSFNAYPLSTRADSWRIITPGDTRSYSVDIKLSEKQQPRQGVNSCGANDVFIFDKKPDFIEPEFLYPLATKEIWRSDTDDERYDNLTPRKWIFLPYDKSTGRVLAADRLQGTRAFDYLLSWKERLLARKGTLISSATQRGLWWSLLGVGHYSFAPYKIIWQAYGKSDFHPIVLSDVGGQPWQGNQSLHAFIPAWSSDDAARICTALRHSQIPTLLTQLNGAGKCNWAQPGKIKKILSSNVPALEN